jgi:hypothetical protein
VHSCSALSMPLTAGPEGAVVLELHRLDASTQHLVATFPPTVFSGDDTDRGRMLTPVRLPQI